MKQRKLITSLHHYTITSFHHFTITPLILVCLLYSCSKDSEAELSTDNRPTWTAVTEGVCPQGMYIIMDTGGLPTLDGKLLSVNSNDLLGAFIGGECRGVSVPYDEIDGKTHFYLKVKSTENDSNDVKVELRYYSAEKTHIFVSESFDFVPDGNSGTLDEGFKPTWK